MSDGYQRPSNYFSALSEFAAYRSAREQVLLHALEYHPYFRRLFPNINLQIDKLITAEPGIWRVFIFEPSSGPRLFIVPKFFRLK